MRRAAWALGTLALVIAGALGCGGGAGTPLPTPMATPAATPTPTPFVEMAAPEPEATPTAAPSADGSVIMEVVVGARREDCVGVAPMECLVVDGNLFYDEIEGFTHTPGYMYRLRILRYDPWGGNEPPADAGLYAYRLLEVLDMNRAGP